jgi:hypothetical protein
VSTEPFLSSDRRDTHRDTETEGREGFLEYAVQVGSVATMYIPSFVKIGSAIQKLNTQTHRQQGDLISPFLFLSK